MRKNILGKFAATAVMMAALICGVGAPSAALTTSAKSTDFDCVYGVNDKTDSFLANGYGSTNIVTYSEAEATAAGVPAGFSGEVLSVEHTAVNRGIMLDFSSQNIPIHLVESLTFRVYVGNDGISTDKYPELRIPEPNTNGAWVMRYQFADKTDTWQEVVLKDGNGSFFSDGRVANFNMLAKDGYLYKLELAIRHNGSNATFYIDSVKIGYVENDGVAPVLTYNGEEEVTISAGQKLNFDVSAVDAVDGVVDVEYVWGDPSKITEDGLLMGGTHTLTFVAKDFFGSTAEKTITVIVAEADVTPPTLIIPVDTIYAKVGARSLFTFTATDDKGDVEVTSVWSEGALDRYERLTKGTHTLTVTATDLSGNQTQKVVTFIVTEEGDTADVIIDEEALCPDPEEPESSEEESSEDITSTEDSTSVEEESSADIDSSEEPETSEEPIISEEPETSEEPIVSEEPTVESEASEVENSQEESEETNEDAKKSGCGSSLGVVAGLPLLALGVCVLLKKKEE